MVPRSSIENPTMNEVPSVAAPDESSIVVRTPFDEEARGMADCHLDAFPDRPMSLMGPDWLEFLYRHYMQAERGVSIVAVQDSQPVGLAVGGHPDLLAGFRRAATRRFPVKLAMATVRSSVVRRSVLASMTGRFRKQASVPPPDEPGTGSLLSICVRSDFEGQGVASRLLDAFQTASAEAGFSSLRLSVLGENTRARRFYERHGWELRPINGSLSVRYVCKLERS